MLPPLASILSEITHAVTGAVGDYGLYAVFALMLVDAVLPAASEAVLVFGGALAAGAFAGDVVLAGYEFPAGFWAFVAIATAGTLGYTVGSVGGWAIGITGGRRFVERYGRWLHLGPDKLERAERWFARWGDSFVFVGRLLPVVRSFVAVPAGVVRMPLGRYTALTLPGSAIWCFALAAVGWGLGENWERFHHAFRYVDYAVGAAILIGAAWLALRWRASRLERRAADPAG